MPKHLRSRVGVYILGKNEQKRITISARNFGDFTVKVTHGLEGTLDSSLFGDCESCVWTTKARHTAALATWRLREAVPEGGSLTAVQAS